ncbi:RHS repeat-associated core domain-containing protein [Methylobacterium tarhaniae]|uniref:RHS repeat-associated core domain-containing protein n=1 Tax=Methylobacterium tarhaniae TaxID=1187852 RepID=UPI003CCA4613
MGFPGQWADNENGLSYNRFRYYDAEAGQYVSPDPIGINGGSSALIHSDGAALPLTALRMAAAGLVQTKGFGFSLCLAM